VLLLDLLLEVELLQLGSVPGNLRYPLGRIPSAKNDSPACSAVAARPSDRRAMATGEYPRSPSNPRPGTWKMSRAGRVTRCPSGR
jgi:hypothetical protein